MRKNNYEDKKLNLHRMTRIEKHYSVSEELKNLILQVDKPQTWMIISETWCGDSAQNIPFIAKIAAVNPRIELKIVMRDSNPDVMDLYLTNGTRSIPILVAFDESGEELFRWGPRPDEAIKLFEDLKTAGIEKAVRLEKLHLWYGRNQGAALESEIKKLVGIT
ncbi:MAG: thioredoxin family protein [Ignavibacteriales bacterium]|nr:thioredoxin family protein [Ignavibacteriales bacterium]